MKNVKTREIDNIILTFQISFFKFINLDKK